MKAAKATRERLSTEYAEIPKHRPIDTVIPLLAREKAKPVWEDTEKCKDIRRGVQIRFCDQITRLETEIAAAKAAGEVQAKLADVDGSILKKGPVAAHADWSASILADLFGVDEQWLSRRLPLATPIVVEVLCVVLFWYGFITLGGGHGIVIDGAPPSRTAPMQRAAAEQSVQSPQLLTLLAPPVPSKQRELAEDFFQHSMRPHSTASLPESVWYKHYQDVCASSGETAMALESFRWFARKYVPEMPVVEGQIYYAKVLPYRPGRAA